MPVVFDPPQYRPTDVDRMTDRDRFMDADRIAAAAIERAREETPQWPRWFVFRYVVCACGAPFCWRRLDIDVLARHADAGIPHLFLDGAWHADKAHVSWTFDVTLCGLKTGECREVGRAAAFTLTGGNP